MRCPWYLFHRLFLFWARTQEPHDPLLPGGPMSCQSAPVCKSMSPETAMCETLKGPSSTAVIHIGTTGE
ncbi:unnamed protein product [Staurois parvus]|uniref:Uncharacterized protein n=1 Tax=Staurois parvus TaxID=386267 RepID=A0ABN9DST6_9NEOB|nr:unnamed protein product [Staurois parvus]